MVSKLMFIKKGAICMYYGYARVSTRGQATDGNSLEAQERELIKNGAEEIYKDIFTGTKGSRPELDKLIDKLEAGDRLIVTKLDRVARSVLHGTQLIRELDEKGVELHILNMGGVMDKSPTGKLLRNVLFSFAEFERDMIVERTTEGKRIAKLNNPNYKEGRKKKYSKVQLDHAIELLQEHSYTQVEKITGISKSTLIREVKKRNYNREVNL